MSHPNRPQLSNESKEERIREIRNTLSLLFSDGDVVELRALGDGGVHSGYFTDFDGMAEKAAVMNRFTDVHGVYVTLNEVNPALLSRRANRVKQHLSRSDATTADADICRRRWLPIDFDPVRPSGVSATDAEHEAALERAEDVADWLTKRGFPEPIIADSGNGAHLLYRIDLPNDGEATRLVKACLTVLDALFSDNRVHCDTANFNAGRIWKLYGTTARKGDNTPERPHRTARICSAPDEPQVVANDLLRELADAIPRTAPATGKRRGSFDLGHWLTTNGISIKTEKPWQGGTLFSLDTCPFSSAHKDGAFAIQFANGALFAGCHHNSCGGGSQRWQELKAMYEPERAVLRQKTRTKPSQQESSHGSDRPPENLPSPSLPADTSAEEQEHRKQALEILTNGDPLAFLLEVFHREHVGDRTVAECLAMSVASQSVENTSGLHVAISGNSGKGKTHACNTMIQLLPEAYRLTGTVSDKALFYHDTLCPGTVLLFDDVSLSDDMQEVLKSSTANFRKPIVHRTLTRERQLRVCTIPERCVWWLAKVESIGDDQIMNRMLTVWIDDTTNQDLDVLDHLKEVESEVGFCVEEDTDVYVCRAIWEIIKEKTHLVRIPFARRINFSVTHNRRNPGMLFDLIKCHALLHIFQRDVDDNGTVIATHDDFCYARRLYLAINGKGGSQETKLTKNESAALETITQMDLQVFTIRQLQDSLGFTYHQVYRLLHGYSVNRIRYQGLLDKCPAISLIDATVAEDLCGVETRQRKLYFSFDLVHYRRWSAQADVWLEEEERKNNPNDNGPDESRDVYNVTTTLHKKTGNIATSDNGRNTPYSTKEEECTEICTENREMLHSLHESYSNPGEGALSDGYVCDPKNILNRSTNSMQERQIDNSNREMRQTVCKPDCKVIANTLNTENKQRRGITLPLPDILNHRDFERSSVILGSCTLCNDGAAVYLSKSQRASICEGCYARLVREWNKGEGVG